MAPKSASRSCQEKDEKKQPSIADEDEETESEPEEENDEGKYEEEDDSSSYSTEEECEEDQENEKLIKTPNPSLKLNSKSIATQEEVGSDSETKSDAYLSSFKVQPIEKLSTTSAKRSSKEIVNGDHPSRSSSKKLKVEGKKSATVPSTPGTFTRVWNNEDEIALLQGMAEFSSIKGKSPTSGMEGFYNFIRGKLQVNFSNDQLRNKLRRMNKRYLNAVPKGDSAADPIFSNPHEDMLFKLSKKIWGAEDENINRSKNGARSAVHENAKRKIQKVGKIDKKEKLVTKEKYGEKEFWSKYSFIDISFSNIVGNFPSLALSEGAMSLIKDKLALIGDANAEDLNEKWRKLLAEEVELNYKMLTLMREQIQLTLDK